jgi:hypothetical protein
MSKEEAIENGFRFWFGVDDILSSNQHLFSPRGRNTLIKTPHAREYAEEIAEQMKLQIARLYSEDGVSMLDQLDKFEYVGTKWVFFKGGFGKDLTNLKKLAEDAVFLYLKHDDKQVIMDTSHKFQVNKIVPKELIMVDIYPLEADMSLMDEDKIMELYNKVVSHFTINFME